MGAVAAALRGRWSRPSSAAGSIFGEPHELDFLKGLAEAFAGESTASLRSSSQRRKDLSYPVPDFLERSGYEGAVNVAVTGNSGVGKSLFINTVRGVKRAEPTWAPVGVSDTTKDPIWYEFPNEPRVRLWDLEGALAGGGAPARREPSDRSSVENYIRTIGLRYFDVVLVLSSGRLTETETEVAQELRFREVPFFFVRTKLDWDIENSQEDYGMTPAEVCDDIRKDLVANDVPDPYLVNARSVEDFDFPRLIRDVLVVVAARWPDLVQQTLEDLTGSPAGDPEQLPRAMKCDEELRPNPGQEPVEALARFTGRWYWARDPTFLDFLRAESGEVVATIAMMLFSNAEHTFIILEDGRWEARVVNSGTGGQPLTSFIVPSNKYSEEMETDFFGHKVAGRGIEYIHEGTKLISEFSGHVKDASGTGAAYPMCYRLIREVVDNEYWVIWQNCTRDISGKRVFARYPHFLIVNETRETVSLSTYSGWALLYPSMTKEVPPGTHYVDCSAKNAKTELAIFKLGTKTLRVPELKAGETFVVRLEDFQ